MTKPLDREEFVEKWGGSDDWRPDLQKVAADKLEMLADLDALLAAEREAFINAVSHFHNGGCLAYAPEQLGLCPICKELRITVAAIRRGGEG